MSSSPTDDGAQVVVPDSPQNNPLLAPATLRVQPWVIDPYEKQKEFPLPWLGRILLFILDLVMVPFRLIVIVLLLTILSLICKILLIGATPALQPGDPGFGPVRTWLLRTIISMFGYLVIWCFGFVSSKLSDAKANTRDGILVCNHIGYAEIMLLVTHYAPSVVAKKEIASYPLVGTIARALQCIFIDRKDPTDRTRVMEMMKERGRDAKCGRYPPLLIFPEGTTTNGAVMLRFQKGIFTCGVPVQPLAIKSHFIFYNAGWLQGSMLNHALQLLTRLYAPFSIQELALYQPNEFELQDPILYADNVCQTIANALQIPVSNKTMYDNPEFHMRGARLTQRRLGPTGGGDEREAPNSPAAEPAEGRTNGTVSVAQVATRGSSDSVAAANNNNNVSEAKSASVYGERSIMVDETRIRIESGGGAGSGGGLSSPDPRKQTSSTWLHSQQSALLERGGATSSSTPSPSTSTPPDVLHQRSSAATMVTASA